MLCVVPPTAAESDASSTLPILYYIIYNAAPSPPSGCQGNPRQPPLLYQYNII